MAQGSLENRFDWLQAFLLKEKRGWEIALDVAAHNGSYQGQSIARENLDFIAKIDRLMSGLDE